MGKKVIIAIASIFAVIVILIFSLPFFAPKFEKNTVVFLSGEKQIKFSVEIADTVTKRAVGLMNRESLPENSGMLFIFEDLSEKTFWMKNTLIPLDIVFVDSNFNIAHIQKNAEPCRIIACQTYSSEKPAKYVIEINGGLSDKLGIKEGQKVKLNI